MPSKRPSHSRICFRPLARMLRALLLLVIVPLISACEEDEQLTESQENQPRSHETEVFRTPFNPDEVVQVLWQKSYPEEYKALQEQHRDNDPFSEVTDIPVENLTPGEFGLAGWSRAIVPRAFEQLGFPLKNGATAAYDHKEGRITVTHSREALDAFRRRFPEFTQIDGGQVVEPDAGSTPE